MKFVIEGEPVPKGRPRFNRKTGTMYTPPTTRSYEQAIAYLAMAQREKFEFEPVKFTAVFFTGKKKPADGDNLLKSVLDGCNGHAFTDDCQVAELHAWRVRSNNPRVEVTIEATTERSELPEMG